MAEQIHAALTILRRKQVEARIGLRRSAIYAMIEAGAFPAPVKLGARAVGWVAGEVDDWLRARVAASRAEVTK